MGEALHKDSGDYHEEDLLGIKRDLFELKDVDETSFWDPEKLLERIKRDEALASLFWLGLNELAKKKAAELGKRGQELTDRFEAASDIYMNGSTPQEYAASIQAMRAVLKDFGVVPTPGEAYRGAFDDSVEETNKLLKDLAKKNSSFKKLLEKFNREAGRREKRTGREQEIFDRRLGQAAKEYAPLGEAYKKFDAEARKREKNSGT